MPFTDDETTSGTGGTTKKPRTIQEVTNDILKAGTENEETD